MGDDRLESLQGSGESVGTSRRRAVSAVAAEKRADRKGESLWYLATAALASLAAGVVMQLWRADLRVPLSYDWDAVSALSGTKGMLENGWFLTNPHLGAPGVQVLWDYPGSEFFNLLALKVIGFFARDAALTVNVYFLLGFPLIALTAFWAARTLGVSRPSSLLVAVLYTVLPYHFLRGEQHLFLSAYALVPPAILLALWAMRSDDRLDVFRKIPPAEKISWFRRSAPVLLCVVIGAAGVYYALFAAFLLGVAGIVASARLRKLKALLPAALLIGVIALTMAVNIAPTLVYKAKAGPNQSAVVRDRSEAQVYGLRIDGLVLPAQGHRIPVLSRLQKGYFAWLGDEASAPYKENASEALGMLGALGFLALLVVLILRSELISVKAKGPDRLLGDASVLNGAIILVATSAGLGAIFSYLVPLIRAYNRISVFVALLALLAVAAIIDRVWAPESRKRLRLAVVLGLIVVALFDQTTPAFIPAYAATARKWKADAEFVSQVEGSLPADSSVFQLPYVPFPESPFVNKMIDYDHLLPYLHSRTIHWSYGTVKGREVDLWQRDVASRKVPEMITKLRAAGFTGLWIDRFGYADGAEAIEMQLTASLKTKGKQSRSGRYIFFKL